MKSKRSKLIKQADKLFAEVVRKRGASQKSGKTDNLQCCHLHSRSKKSVRWNLDNAFCLTAGEHLFWAHKEPVEFVEWAKCILGEDRYIALNERARIPRKWSISDLEILIAELKDILNIEGE